MRQVKEKCPCTAATVTEARPINRINYTLKKPACKVGLSPAAPDSLDTEIAGGINILKKLYYRDGLEGKPYCNNFTYEGLIAAFGQPAPEEDNRIVMVIYDLCDSVFRAAWERGRADAAAGEQFQGIQQILPSPSQEAQP